MLQYPAAPCMPSLRVRTYYELQLLLSASLLVVLTANSYVVCSDLCFMAQFGNDFSCLDIQSL
jgi:hypothetical protein